MGDHGTNHLQEMETSKQVIGASSSIKSQTEADQEEKVYPSLKLVIPAMIALYLSTFLVAIDRTILGTAIPAVANHFNSFGDISWYEAGFLLPICALQLSFGRVYTYYSPKWVLVVVAAIFEIGSIICATAQSSNALIVGRVISGIGGAGISGGPTILITRLVPLQSQPKWQGGFGAIFGLASILGPLLGGYLTAVSWRWCFWINVPIGGVALAFLAFFAPNIPPSAKAEDTIRGKADQLDPIGFVLIVSTIVCLLFGVQWGGIKYPWSDGRIIALFTVFGVLAIAFAISQYLRGDKATVPFHFFAKRSLLSAGVASLATGSAMIVLAYYLPIWFQVVQGKTPQSSGLSLLPLLLSVTISVVIGGILTSFIGYFTPWLFLGSTLLIIGCALISTWHVGVGAGIWIGYQIVAGVGTGLILMVPIIAAQTVLADKDLPVGISLLQFVNMLGGTVFVTVAQTLFQHRLVKGLKTVIPDLDPASVSGGGATTFRNTVSPAQLPAVLDVYNKAMRDIWYLALGISCLAFLAAFGMPWNSVKTKKPKKDTDDCQDEEKQQANNQTML